MKKNNCEKWLKISSGARNVMKHVMLGVYAAMGIIYCPYKIMMAVVAAVAEWRRGLCLRADER